MATIRWGATRAQLGGQLNMARRIPGKSEFDETLRYHRTRLHALGVDLRLGRRVSAAELAAELLAEARGESGQMPRLLMGMPA